MRFHIENMTCGHCERSIRRALSALSPTADIAIDLRARTLDLDGTLSATQVVTTLAEEGYTAVRITELA